MNIDGITSRFSGKTKINRKPPVTLLSKGRKRECFLGSENCFLGEERKKINGFDSLNYRIAIDYGKRVDPQNSILWKKYLTLRKKVLFYNKQIAEGSRNYFKGLSLLKLWNASLLTAVLIGMFSMSFIYRYLGTGASAGENIGTDQLPTAEQTVVKKWSREDDKKYIEKIINELKNRENNSFETQIREMVKGYPIEKMAPYIVKQDKIVAAFLVAIAKKESNWGKRVPVLDGKDCYNYWGYRAKRKRMGTGGHTCFNSRQDAVETVAKRIETLVKEYNRDTPAEMIVWKCGYSCAGHSDYSVRKWIADVDLYFNKFQQVTKKK